MSDEQTVKLIQLMTSVLDIVRAKLKFFHDAMERVAPGDIFELEKIVSRLKLSDHLEEQVVSGLSIPQLEPDMLKTFFNRNVRPIVEIVKDPHWEQNLANKLKSSKSLIQKKIIDITNMSKVRSTIKGQMKTLKGKINTARREVEMGTKEVIEVKNDLAPLELLEKPNDGEMTQKMVLKSRLKSKQSIVKSAEIAMANAERELSGKESIVSAKNTQIIQVKEELKHIFESVFPYQNWKKLATLRSFVININAKAGDSEAMALMEEEGDEIGRHDDNNDDD